LRLPINILSAGVAVFGHSINEPVALVLRSPFPGSRNDDDLSDLDVAVQVAICVLATSRRSIAPMSGAL
jgi:hypothetical protein